MPRPTRPTPPAVLEAMLRADPGRPRLTCYDDATGERVELSARTLATWVAKAANLLQEDADAGPGTTVGLQLPAHWRCAYWALAAWSVGACVVTGPEAADADVLVSSAAGSTAAAAAAGRYAVLVTLAALARGNPDTPAGVVDESRELAAYPDDFAPWAQPADADPAWRADGGQTAYGELVAEGRQPAGTRARVPDEPAAMLRAALDTWAAGGSIVLCHNAVGDQADRLAAERVTVDLTG